MKGAIFLIIFVLIFLETNSSTFIEMAKQAMDSGKYSVALEMYGKAIEENPKNHIAYFLRGSLHDIFRRSNSALADYNSALEIKPSFNDARFKRANYFTKLGKIEKAIEDLSFILKNDPKDMRQQVQMELEILDDVILKKATAKKLFKEKDFKKALDYATAVSDKLTMDIDLRLEICEILEKLGDENGLVSELITASLISPKDDKLLFKVADKAFFIGKLEESQIHLKKCLSLDPDNTKCKELFRKQRTVRKLIAEIDNDFEKANYKNIHSLADKLVQHVPGSQFFKTKSDVYKCRAFEKLGDYEPGLKLCGQLITNNPDNVEARFARANMYIDKELYDDAKLDVNAVLKIEDDNQTAKELLQKIEKLLKNANRKDYYKILNVTKKATKEEISRSYRKLAKEWHPDRVRDEEKIKVANQKLQDLNAAYQVLTDTEKRRLFDQGIDPLDPTQQSSDSGDHHFGSQGSFFDFFNRGGGGGGNNFRFTFG